MKIRTSRLAAAAVAAIALLLPSCAPLGYIRVSSIAAPARRVMERHDAYVKADESLTDIQRETRLRTSELLERVLKAAEDAAAGAGEH
jgi:hypothetical protein